MPIWMQSVRVPLIPWFWSWKHCFQLLGNVLYVDNVNFFDHQNRAKLETYKKLLTKAAMPEGDSIFLVQKHKRSTEHITHLTFLLIMWSIYILFSTFCVSILKYWIISSDFQIPNKYYEANHGIVLWKVSINHKLVNNKWNYIRYFRIFRNIE